MDGSKLAMQLATQTSSTLKFGDLIFGEELGTGRFGAVVKGTLKGTTEVAIKTIKKDVAIKQFQTLQCLVWMLF
jgi:hypothetical protein